MNCFCCVSTSPVADGTPTGLSPETTALPEGTAHGTDTSSQCHSQAIRDHSEQRPLATQAGSTGHLRTRTVTPFHSHNRTTRWSKLTRRRTDQSSGHTPRSPIHADGNTGPSPTTGRPSLAGTRPGCLHVSRLFPRPPDTMTTAETAGRMVP